MLVKYLYAAMMVMGLLYFYQTAQGYSHTGYRLPSKTVTYSCGSPELRQAVQEIAAVSGLVDGGCSATPAITLHLVPDSQIVAPIQGYGGPGNIYIPVRNEHHYGIILHETLHAGGLGHSAETMNAPYILRTAAAFYLCCNPLNEDDVAGLQALYGPPETTTYKLYVPALAR